jgi:hypothetical protein
MKTSYFNRIMAPLARSDRAAAIRPEHERRAAMNEYADLQKFKLKFLILVGALVLLARFF